MNLIIKELKPELSEDYFDFFDNRAFSDGSPNYPCYCNAFNMTIAQIRSELFEQAEMNGGGLEGWKKSLRSSAEKMIQHNQIKGYLAYDKDIVIGWCNANDKESYYRFGEFSLDNLPLKDDNTGKESSEKIKSVVCFEIAPEYRGMGIATALLNRVCEDAKVNGYDYVEVYPMKRKKRETFDFTGPVCLYEKVGFTCFKMQGDMMIMRKKLRIENEIV